MGSEPGSPFGLEYKYKAPWTSWMFNFWRIYRLSTSPTNKKLEVWTQYSLLLSFLGGYFSSFKNILRQSEICIKSWKHENKGHWQNCETVRCLEHLIVRRYGHSDVTGSNPKISKFSLFTLNIWLKIWPENNIFPSENLQNMDEACIIFWNTLQQIWPENYIFPAET